MRVKVAEVMARDVPVVEGDTPFKTVAQALIAADVGAVPVVDAQGRVMGVVTDADLLLKEEFKDQYAHEGYRPPLRARLRHLFGREGRGGRAKSRGDTAAELMTTPAVTIGPGTAVVFAIRLMDEHGVAHLPVVGTDGALEGMVGRHDLLRVFTRPDADIAHEITTDILGRSLFRDMSMVDVTVDQGVVTLAGRLRRRSDALTAARLARGVNGVVDVVDRLEWEEDDTHTWRHR
ncbi:CBS domain-containing protein [Microbispora sp. H13382]|uniref:CBS domain-containing protein n=1 Tax=Microbispora sp. H13382 TaxID=2729112 RepID=UPI0016003AEA|nr:CBS domain-containing protein [Microbispora sp. H13382]